MKKVKALYWIFTGLFIAFMLVTSLSQVISSKGAEEVMTILQMPMYLLPLLGISKLLAIAAIVISGFPKIKEWAYAGVMFDFIAATYCMIAVGGTIDKWGFMILPILLCGLSYYFYNRLLKIKTENS
jgi:hypothetical protein